MTADACPDRREDIGAYAIAQLGADRELALRAHFDGCPACRLEAGELGAVAALVPLVDLDHLPDAPAPRTR